MNHAELNKLHKDLIRIRSAVEDFKHQESDFEKNRLLKMIDAELIDAIHNMEHLVLMVKEGKG